MQEFDDSGLTGNQRWFYHWILRREEARLGNENGLQKPWTTDPILQNYRFCNVRREDDKVTKWIKANWRDPFCEGDATHPNMVVAMCIARLFNRPETLDVIGFPHFATVDFTKWLEGVRLRLKARRSMGETIWTGAYLVSTNGHAMDKIDYILDMVVAPIYKKARNPEANESLESYHKYLTSFDGLGSFMAGQVIADLKYTPALAKAPDWDSWAPIGPGSKRGLNRYFGRKLEAGIKMPQVLEELAVLQYAVRQRLGISLPAHDIQNCCCEYDKYLRVMLGEGKPRSGYNGR